MNPGSLKEAEKTFLAITKGLEKVKGVAVVICPPAPFIYALHKLSGSRKIKLGAQDVFWERSGSYTGEVSASQLKEVGAKFVIINHSERRALGETDSGANKKVSALLREEITPVVCIGEARRDKEGLFLSYIENQIKTIFEGVSAAMIRNVVIAYEPVWAIGGTESMKPTEIYEMTILIRKILSSLYNNKIGAEATIIYGGSVNAENIEEIMREGNVQGVLPGRASQEPEPLAKIIGAVASTHR